MTISTRPSSQTTVVAVNLSWCSFINRVDLLINPKIMTTCACLRIITRHPLHEKDLFNVMSRWSTKPEHRTLEKLLTASKVQVIKRHGQSFWSAADSYYEEK